MRCRQETDYLHLCPTKSLVVSKGALEWVFRKPHRLSLCFFRSQFNWSPSLKASATDVGETGFEPESFNLF